jgi:hypothetical protein
MSSAALWVVLLANLFAFLLKRNNSQRLFYHKQSPIKKKENVTIHAELQTHSPDCYSKGYSEQT